MKNIWEYLEHAAKTVPERIALSDGELQLTYKEYFEEAAGVARQLAALGYSEGARPIGVVAKHTVWTPVFYMGIAKSGNYYVPLDPELPAEKRKMVIEGSGMKLILSETAGKMTAEAMEDAGQTDSETVWDADGDAPLYVVYTSGSTGTPKGIRKGHEAVIDFVEAFSETFPYEDGEIVGNQTPFFFDASAKDIYLALYNCVTLEIIPMKLFSFPVKLIEYLNEKKISLISWVPSALSIITKLDAFSEVKPVSLKRVFFVGEVFPMKQLNKWRRELPDLTYVNLYGSSEIAGICCYYEILPEDIWEDTESLPIGRPLKNCKIVLVKDGKAVSKPKVTGEIFVASKALAEGYFGDKEKTEAVFVNTDPDGAGEKRYLRTGDLAFYNEKNQLVFASRKDFQIKHMGHRIELGEIEAAAFSIEGIRNCGCIYDDEKDRIVLICEIEQDEGKNSLNAPGIRNILREKMSSYMVPNKVFIIDKIPLNANGKVDRISLKNNFIKSR